MTKKMMAQFGLKNAAQTHGLEARATAYAIEPDATAASYFLTLPLVTGGALALNALRGPGSDSLQGDTRFATVLAGLGLGIQETDTCLIASAARLSAIPHSAMSSRPPAMRAPSRNEPSASHQTIASGDAISALSRSVRTPHSYNFNEFSDTFLTLAAIAPLLPHPVRITGIAHTRKQETDRVAGMARELARLGQRVIETEDSLEIHPRPLLAGQTIDTYHDHRFAMSFGILGCHDLHGDGRPWLTIDNPACCAKTFPDFFEQLEKIREKLKG
ncbi:hypothetical protein CKA38_01180 [Ereboglobus luteus]|uniref:Enolpyruvate transferase domain-containing protein n=2 Tax=Ereboglobus luteus TaxID=1796921 RepID=A0A2U8DZT0_9BACT|nr:hypothetical protein CKA38_01180 [Ereboglobus luteus]